MTYPTYLKEKRLPKGGPDRVRFCFFYESALSKGKEHDEAMDEAFGCLNILYYYVGGGIADRLGPVVGQVPIKYRGEE